MKLHFLWFSFLLLFSTITFSQVQMGVKAGATVANFSSVSILEQGPEYSPLPGFITDIFLEIPFSTIFSLQTGLQFYTGGARGKMTYNYTFPGETGFSNIKIENSARFRPYYLALPLYIQAGIRKQSHRFSLGVGPVLNYGLGGKATFRISAVPSIENIKGDIKLFTKDNFHFENISGIPYEFPNDKPLLKRMNIGVSGLLNYEFKSRYIASVSYHYGIKNISNAEEEKLRSHVFAIMVGYRFK